MRGRAICLTLLAAFVTVSAGRGAGALAEVGLLEGAARMTLHLSGGPGYSCSGASAYSAVMNYANYVKYDCEGSITGRDGILSGGGDRVAEAYAFAGGGAIGVVTENLTYETGCDYSTGYSVGNVHATITFDLGGIGATTIGGVATITQARVTTEVWFSWSSNLGIGLGRGLRLQFNNSNNRVFDDPNAILSIAAILNNGAPMQCFSGPRDLELAIQVTAAHHPG